MKKLRISNEDEMILEFLKGEIKSDRFNEDLEKTFTEDQKAIFEKFHVAS